MGFMITSEQILWICSSLAVIWTAWNIVKQIKKPSDDQRNMVTNHEAELQNVKSLLDKDNRRLTALEQSYVKVLEQQNEQVKINKEIADKLNNKDEADKMIIRSLYVLINHSITGNGVDKLKETRDALNEYLIDK